MKRIFFAILFVLACGLSFGQVVSPVSWTAVAKKIKDKVYELHITASINKGWHIYSQATPDGGPVPTVITFTKNPLFELDGKPNEVGKLEQHHEELFGVDVKQFSNKVDFVQVVKLKANVATSVDVAIEFMTCNDKQCLPPSTKKFTVALNK